MNSPGTIILFGSGETTPQAITLMWKFFGAHKIRQRIAILETPAGFQPNSSQVAQEIADSYQHSLGSMIEQLSVIPARSIAEPHFSPNNETLLEPLKSATSIFLGPGSPTYAVSQLQNSLAWRMVLDRWQEGASLIFSSAATLAAGTYTLPVYEIYKVGSPLHWVNGLAALESVLPNTAIVGHWNNQDGGQDLDTSHCFMGEKRFHQLQKLLSSDASLFGIDEHTGVIIDPAQRVFMPLGLGSAYRLWANQSQMFGVGKVYSLDSFEQITESDEKTFFSSLRSPDTDALSSELTVLPPHIQALIDERLEAKHTQDFARADTIREQLLQMGYQIEDTKQGTNVRVLAKDT